MSERQIVLDTETTGLDVAKGDRLIEVAAIEMQDRRPTRREFHRYVNPNTAVTPGAFKVHGISDAFLASHPPFEEIAQALWTFLCGATLIIHNAPFDLAFLNHEFSVWRGETVSLEAHCVILDTLTLARKKHPRQKNTLDALCRRYKVDNAARERHGALLDTQLLLAVFLAMTTQQTSLFDVLGEEKPTKPVVTQAETGDERGVGVAECIPVASLDESSTTPVVYLPDAAEMAAHQAFLEQLAKINRNKKHLSLIW